MNTSVHAPSKKETENGAPFDVHSSNAITLKIGGSLHGDILKSIQAPLPQKARALFLGLVIALVSCSSPAEKVRTEEKALTDAKEDLNKAQENLDADVAQFRLEAERKIANTENDIAVLQVKIKNSRSKRRAEYEEQIAVLEQRNVELKQKMYSYRAESNESWEAFKTEFNSDMEELGTSLKNFAVSDND
jgi:restriction endonuclease S subunit